MPGGGVFSLLSLNIDFYFNQAVFNTSNICTLYYTAIGNKGGGVDCLKAIQYEKVF